MLFNSVNKNKKDKDIIDFHDLNQFFKKEIHPKSLKKAYRS